MAVRVPVGMAVAGRGVAIAAGGALGTLLAGKLVFDGLGAGDIGVADFGVEAGQIAFQQIVPGLEADVARGSKGAVICGADFFLRPTFIVRGMLPSFLIVGGD